MRSENLFVVGPQSVGESFIGRKESLRRLRQLFVDGSSNVSLVGLPRVGKSSLAAMLAPTADEQAEKKIAWIPLDISTLTGRGLGEVGMWQMIVSQLRRRLRRLGVDEAALWIDEDLDTVLGLDAAAPGAFVKLQSALDAIFRELKNEGVRVLLVLDEFDSIKTVLGNGTGPYCALRDFISQPYYDVRALAVSRRRLHTILGDSGSDPKDRNSTFWGVFQPERLQAFDANEMREYERRLAEYGLTLTEADRAVLEEYTGRQPFLLSRLGREMAQRALDGQAQLPMDALCAEQAPFFREHYAWVEQALESDGYLPDLLDMVYGSGRYVPEDVKETLFAMGYLEQDENGWHTISEYFTRSLQERLRCVPLSAKLLDTQRLLRQITALRMPAVLGCGEAVWQQKFRAQLEERNGRDARYSAREYGISLEVLDGFVDSSQRKYGYAPTLLEVVSFGSLVRMMQVHWVAGFMECFQDSPRSMEQWKIVLDDLSIVRDPVLHANEDKIYTEEECRKYSHHCDVLQKQLRDWLKSRGETPCV